MRLAICALIPIAASALLTLIRFPSRRARNAFTEAATVLTSLCVFGALLFPKDGVFECFRISDEFVCAFRSDGLGAAFIGLAAFLWPFASLYAFEYMSHESREGQFFTFYTLAYGVTILLAASANLFTMYIFYECLTLVTLPLVDHGRDKESYRAGRAYLTYLIGGASLGFAAMVILSRFTTGSFALGGILTENAQNHQTLLLCAFLLSFFGFGAKAAVFPLSRWLPKASVAPTPVTALLHAVAVVNAGVFAVIRATYYCFGAEFLSGTWAQTAAVLFSAFTIAYGAGRALREGHLKRRLAWSTVSNLSYMLLAVSLMTENGMAAGLTHMIFHGVMKIVLFFCAGALLTTGGITRVSETRGLARSMPVTFLAFAAAGMALIGVPPLCGFLSKYLIISSALNAGGWAQIVGAGAMIVSAILTAAYIFTVIVPAFYLTPSRSGAQDPGLPMKITLIALTAAVVLVSLLSGRISGWMTAIAGGN